MEAKRAQELQKTAAQPHDKPWQARHGYCVDMHTGDTDYRSCLYLCPKVITASIPCVRKECRAPVSGEAIDLGLDLLALAVCLRGNGDEAGLGVTGCPYGTGSERRVDGC